MRFGNAIPLRPRAATTQALKHCSLSSGPCRRRRSCEARSLAVLPLPSLSSGLAPWRICSWILPLARFGIRSFPFRPRVIGNLPTQGSEKLATQPAGGLGRQDRSLILLKIVLARRPWVGGDAGLLSTRRALLQSGRMYRLNLHCRTEYMYQWRVSLRLF